MFRPTSSTCISCEHLPLNNIALSGTICFLTCLPLTILVEVSSLSLRFLTTGSSVNSMYFMLSRTVAHEGATKMCISARLSKSSSSSSKAIPRFSCIFTKCSMKSADLRMTSTK